MMTAHGRKQGRSHVQDNLTADAAAGRRVLSPGSLPCAVDGQRPGRAGSGLGGVTAFLRAKLRRQDIGGHITAAMFWLMRHGEVRTRTGVAVLVIGAVIYAAGSVLLARPYVSRSVTLLIAVPVAAVAGMAVLGALALVVAVLFGALGDQLAPGVYPGGGGGRKRARRRRQ
jgi:hypothetical protein